MYTLAVIVDNKNHEFLSKFLKRNCKLITISEVSLKTILDYPLNNNFLDRLRIARKINRWVKENNNYQAVLILSDLNFAYRTMVHSCRSNKKPIFVYQDGFIFLEPWSKNLLGYFKRLVYQSCKLLGVDHLLSYQSFHTNPDLVFSWGDFFSRKFSLTTTSEIITLGSIMHDKPFSVNSIERTSKSKILFYGTFYRDFEKDILAKTDAIDHLKRIILSEEGLICDIKLHPLDKNRSYLEQLVQRNSLTAKIHFLDKDFLLHENIEKYRTVISELSTETIFASLFFRNIFFFKTSLNEKHFKSLNGFLINQRIGDGEFYTVDPDQIDYFQAEYFQKFNIERFEQAVQKHS